MRLGLGTDFSSTLTLALETGFDLPHRHPPHSTCKSSNSGQQVKCAQHCGKQTHLVEGGDDGVAGGVHCVTVKVSAGLPRDEDGGLPEEGERVLQTLRPAGGCQPLHTHRGISRVWQWAVGSGLRSQSARKGWAAGARAPRGRKGRRRRGRPWPPDRCRGHPRQPARHRTTRGCRSRPACRPQTTPGGRKEPRGRSPVTRPNASQIRLAQHPLTTRCATPPTAHFDSMSGAHLLIVPSPWL